MTHVWVKGIVFACIKFSNVNNSLLSRQFNKASILSLLVKETSILLEYQQKVNLGQGLYMQFELNCCHLQNQIY